MGSSVEGDVLLADMRLSVNLATPSIEFVVSKMRTANLQQVDQIRADLASIGAPPRVTCALDGLRKAHLNQDPSWFNVASNFQSATNTAIELQTDAFTVLSTEELWHEEEGQVRHAQFKPALCPSQRLNRDAESILRNNVDRECVRLSGAPRSRRRCGKRRCSAPRLASTRTRSGFCVFRLTGKRRRGLKRGARAPS